MEQRPADIKNLIKDEFLQSVLQEAIQTREQCFSLLQAVEAEPASGEGNGEETHSDRAKQQKLLAAHLSRLRGMTRRAIFAARQAKVDTAEARSEIDTLHLQLQNLRYEQRHLHGEITACESYDHKYTQLPLIPIDQFLEQKLDFTETNPDTEADDYEHQLMIARIEHELAEREALEAARQELLKKKQGLIAFNKKRKDDLASLDNDLEKFIDAAKPIQKLFEKEY